MWCQERDNKLVAVVIFQSYYNWSEINSTWYHPEANSWVIDPWKAVSQYKQTPQARRLQGEIKQEPNKWLYVADKSSSVHTWDLDKGEDGKERHKIWEIMTASQAYTSPRTEKDNQTDKQRDKYKNLTNMTRQARILSQDLDSNCDTKSKAVWPLKKASG